LFGPVSELGIDPQIDTWPLDRAEVSRKLNNGEPLDPESIRAMSQEVQGFHVLEFILFGDGKTANTINPATLTPRALQYLVSASVLLVDYTGQLAHAWTTNADPNDSSLPGYSELLGNPSLDNPKYTSEQQVYTELVEGMLGIIDEVATGKIATPFGGDIGSVQPEAEESPYSWNSLADFSDNIRSILNVYNGEVFGEKTGPGIRDIVAAKNPALADLVDARIRQSIQKILDIAGPNGITFRDAIRDPAGRVRVQAAIDDLLALGGLIDAEVKPIVER
jgi:putative iron-regulated protein